MEAVWLCANKGEGHSVTLSYPSVARSPHVQSRQRLITSVRAADVRKESSLSVFRNRG